MKKFKTLASLLVFSLCLCMVMASCGGSESETTGSVTSIKLKYNDGDIPGNSLTVKVTDGPLTFTADVQVKGGASKDFTLESSDTTVATVSEKTVTLAAPGITTITATAVGDSTKKHAITLNVSERDSVVSIKLKYDDIEITGNSLTVDRLDGPLAFTANVQTTGNASRDFTLESSNAAIASVSEKTVTLIAIGDTTITATAVGDITKKHIITLSVINDTTPIPGLNAPYYITNNLGEDSSSEFYVQWHNDANVNTQKLQVVAATESDFDNATTIKVTGVSFQTSGNVGVFPLRKIFRARVTGLTPNTDYKYRMGDRGAWSDTYNYSTSSGTTDSFNFIVVSDPQSATHAEMTATLRAADDFDPYHKFYLMGGDLVDQIGLRPAEIVSYTNAAKEFNIKKPIAATQGNHDTHYTDGTAYRFGEAEVFNAFITFPDNGGDTQADKAKRSQSYYFYYNKVLIIMLNTMATSVGVTSPDPVYTRQVNWLKDVLENDRTKGLSRYKIVLTHVGPLGSRDSNRYPTSNVRAAFAKIFTDYGVDIVFSGHDHVYARSNPIKITVNLVGGTNDTDLVNMENAGNFNTVAGGTIFSVVSATGPKFYEITKSDTWIPKFFPKITDEQEPGVFVHVSVTEEKLIVTAKRIDNVLVSLDSYEVMKK
jgi:acid phosphatase type 7